VEAVFNRAVVAQLLETAMNAHFPQHPTILGRTISGA
jgi:hypothetical protein